MFFYLDGQFLLRVLYRPGSTHRLHMYYVPPTGWAWGMDPTLRKRHTCIVLFYSVIYNSVTVFLLRTGFKQKHPGCASTNTQTAKQSFTMDQGTEWILVAQLLHCMIPDNVKTRNLNL